MSLKIWRFVSLLLTALALTPTSAHVLEMPQKMGYDPSLYSAVNTTMYRYFATVGGVYIVGSLLATFVLAFLTRGNRKVFRWTLAAAALLALSFVSWIVLVSPVNGQIAGALRADPGSVPALWMRLRGRWEYGHMTGFLLELLGFVALVLSVLADMPGDRGESGWRG